MVLERKNKARTIEVKTIRLERLRIATKVSKEKENERYLRFSFPVLLVSSRAIDNEEDDET